MLEFYLLSKDSWISGFFFGMAAGKLYPAPHVPGEWSLDGAGRAGAGVNLMVEVAQPQLLSDSF